jgi:hypothetical protein
MIYMIQPEINSKWCKKENKKEMYNVICISNEEVERVVYQKYYQKDEEYGENIYYRPVKIFLDKFELYKS